MGLDIEPLTVQTFRYRLALYILRKESHKYLKNTHRKQICGPFFNAVAQKLLGVQMYI